MITEQNLTIQKGFFTKNYKANNKSYFFTSYNLLNNKMDMCPSI